MLIVSITPVSSENAAQLEIDLAEIYTKQFVESFVSTAVQMRDCGVLYNDFDNVWYKAGQIANRCYFDADSMIEELSERGHELTWCHGELEAFLDNVKYQWSDAIRDLLDCCTEEINEALLEAGFLIDSDDDDCYEDEAC